MLWTNDFRWVVSDSWFTFFLKSPFAFRSVDGVLVIVVEGVQAALTPAS